MTKNKQTTLGQTRRRSMLDAATELFLEKGFERTSLSDIINRSKGSRSTLYEQFGNKDGLLRAMIAETCTNSWSDFQEGVSTSMLDEEALVEYGVKFVNTALTPHMMAVFRIVVTESHLVPDLAKVFFENGPQIFKQRMTEQFRMGGDVEQSTRLSENIVVVFIGAIMGDIHFRRSIGVCPMTPEQIKNHVRTAVKIFLHGVDKLVEDSRQEVRASGAVSSSALKLHNR